MTTIAGARIQVLTVEQSRQATSRHVIVNEQFLVLGEVKGSERHHILVLNLTQNLHLHLELFFGHHNILQALHHYRGPFLQHRLIRSPHAPLPQHLRRSPQQILQIETNTSLFLSASAEPPVISSFDDDVPASAGAARATAATGFGGFAGCLRRRRKQSSNSSSNNAAARTDPKTIATMAPVESFLDFLYARLGFKSDDGDGAGAGKKGLQAFNGGPQRSTFPANEASGNLDSVLGIEPLRRL
ncbi:hypothetical protein CR513_46747, partial [Mucuna pruriens]